MMANTDYRRAVRLLVALKHQEGKRNFNEQDALAEVIRQASRSYYGIDACLATLEPCAERILGKDVADKLR